MDSLNCEFLRANNGWHCHPLPDRVEETLYVCTPIVLEGGKPLDFFLIARGQNLLFTDDCLTMFALGSEGVVLDKRHHWRGLQNLVERFDFYMTERGAIETLIPANELAWHFNRILRMFSAVAGWQADKLEQGDSDFWLTDEVERLLREKAPTRQLVSNVHVTLKGAPFDFDFRWGTLLVDALPPTARAVSSRLRKAILAAQDDADLGLLFIIDDREDRAKAEREQAVLGQVADTTTLSDFAERYVVLQD
ncbi:DUF1828 domain-containing protein [Luteimonas granuli]|uniref:DUF1828 domain-containing protein n=1 Tax=Luteimonas granuli TaxID=1176533 RepID=A0A518N1Q1_9GAMM|nr:DUF1828 domain-containing protein [Luteimonas granuli]QDW65819.1 DUF1828 domain-containing protein [Luteimonas granuli]